MNILKKIGVRFLFLAGIFLLANFIYKKTLWEQDLKSSDGKILTDFLNAQDSADVIYLGESSNFAVGVNDTCSKNISAFAADYFPSLVFKPVHKGAIHAGTYLALLKQLKNNVRVKTVVVTLNLRSFDADWINTKLETSLMRTDVLLQKYPPLINRFLLSLNAYNKKSEKQLEQDMLAQLRNDALCFPYNFKYKNAYDWNVGMANNVYLKGNKNKDSIDKINLACHYIKTYAFQINTQTNPRIKDFDKIVTLCKQKNLHLIFNLLAENVEYADSLAGKDLVFLIKQNRDLLMKRYNKDGIFVVDNLEAVRGKDYIDQNWTTEHYNQRGRILVAQNLANALKIIYPKEFEEIASNKEKEINAIKNRIKASDSWMNDIKRKAKENNLSIEEMIERDAKYVYETEIKFKIK